LRQHHPALPASPHPHWGCRAGDQLLRLRKKLDFAVTAEADLTLWPRPRSRFARETSASAASCRARRRVPRIQMLAPDERAISAISASPAFASPAQGRALIMAARSQVRLRARNNAAPRRSKWPPASRTDQAAAAVDTKHIASPVRCCNSRDNACVTRTKNGCGSISGASVAALDRKTRSDRCRWNNSARRRHLAHGEHDQAAVALGESRFGGNSLPRAASCRNT